MKIKHLIFALMLLVPASASADVWYPSGNYLTPVNSIWGIKLPSILNCNTNSAITTNGTGQFLCGSISGGGGGGSDVNWTFYNNSGLRTSTSSLPVVIGANATTSLSKLQVFGGATIDKATTTQATTTSYAILDTLSSILKTTSIGNVIAAIAGTDYEVPLTFSTGLTRAVNTITVNTTQNIAKLSNLTGNGFVKTSGGDGTLSVDTNTYLTAAITALGPTGQTQTGATQTLASSTAGTDFTITASGNTQTFNLPIASAVNTGKLSSTDWSTFNGKQPAGTYVTNVTASGNIASSGGTTPNITFTGTLPVANGGTGSTTLTGILKGNGTGAVQTAVSNTDYQAPITLTTTGSSGASTFNGTTLNIPQYTGGGSGYPFPGAGNSTTTLVQLNGGFTAYASSTVGDGTGQGGLSVNGTASTSRDLYVAGGLGVAVPNSSAGSISLTGNISSNSTNFQILANPTSGNIFFDAAASNNNGSLFFRTGGSSRMTLSGTAISFSVNNAGSGVGVPYTFTGVGSTGLTASTEAVGMLFNNAVTRTHANGALALQREFLVNAPTYAFASATSTLTDTGTLAVSGAPKAGAFANVTNSSAIHIQAGSVAGAGSVANSYGLNVNAQTGATNNYASVFLGGNSGFKVSSPSQLITLSNASSIGWDNGSGSLATTCLATSSISNGLKITDCSGETGAGSGISQIIAGNMYTATASQTINTSAETTLFSSTKTGTTTVPANFLTVGRTFSLHGKGQYSTPAGNLETLTGRLKFGATTISSITTAALPASATNQPFRFDIDCTIRSIGASGSVMCDGEIEYQTVLSGTNVWVTNDISSISPATIDTTAKSNWDVTADWSSTAFTTQSLTATQSWIDIRN